MERTMMKREITMVISIRLALSKLHHHTDHTTHSLITGNDLIVHRRLTSGPKTRQLSLKALTPSRYIFKWTQFGIRLLMAIYMFSSLNTRVL
jgi:hypothetical protein